MYEIVDGSFTTPRGVNVTLSYRRDTNDADVLRSCLTEDEYGLADHHFSGWALDIGAHIGGATVALLMDNPDLRVAAYEPVRENAELLLQNVERLDLRERVFVSWMAATQDDERHVEIGVRFTGNPAADIHHFVGNQSMLPGTGHETRTVPATGLADIIDYTGPLSMVKIDCEGCEYAFLSSPTIINVERIHGEYHKGRDRLFDLLTATHFVEFDGDDQIGTFQAVRHG